MTGKLSGLAQYSKVGSFLTSHVHPSLCPSGLDNGPGDIGVVESVIDWLLLGGTLCCPHIFIHL